MCRNLSELFIIIPRKKSTNPICYQQKLLITKSYVDLQVNLLHQYSDVAFIPNMVVNIGNVILVSGLDCLSGAITAIYYI